MRAPITIWIGALVATGCIFDNSGANNNNSNNNNQHGFGAPTVELTVDGVHLGPARADGSAAASLADTRDGLGTVVQSTFTVSASSSAAGADCGFTVQRYAPSGTTPIVAIAYQLATPTSDTTGDGTVAVTGTVRADGQGHSWACGGSDCDGAVLALDYLAADHVEGSLSAALATSDGSSASQIVCAFYLPMAGYTP
jgi:hypothetical protein